MLYKKQSGAIVGRSGLEIVWNIKLEKQQQNLRKNIFYPKRTLPVTFLSINFLITLGCSCKLQSDVLRKTNFVLVMLNILCCNL